MPGRLFLTRPLDEIAADLAAEPAPGVTAPPRRNIAPRQEILVATPDGALRSMRWGIVPVGRVNARGRPVMELIVNARGETLFAKSAYRGVRRGLIPADGWYEWTGRGRRKTAWRIARRDAAPIAFAAIWDVWDGAGVSVAQAAIVTTEPSLDVRAVHDRMGVIVAPADRATWLCGDEGRAAALIGPRPMARSR